MAEKTPRTNESAPEMRGQGQASKPLKVMGQDGAREPMQSVGCSDLRHPNLPFWHPLNGPFPTD